MDHVSRLPSKQAELGAGLADAGEVGDHRPLVICDLTQSYSPAGGGGISTYLREKSAHVLRETPHTLLQIVPGPADRIVVNGRHIFAEVGAKRVPGSPNYRFILRTCVVRKLLAHYRPDIVESLCPWVLPWTAINHRRAFPETALVAGYRTDFPNAHVHRVASDLFGARIATGLRRASYGYARRTYRAFDWVYTLGEDNRAILGQYGIDRTSILPLGVDTTMFTPAARDPKLREKMGLKGGGRGPLLVYAGRIDNEKRADKLLAMVRLLPPDLGAALVMIGDGKLRAGLEAQTRVQGLPIAFTGFEHSRGELARALASADIYVSAMADETFGISVLEAQAAGLPVVGVASGAMPDRVPAGLGLLGPVDDPQAMADNVVAVWNADHAAMGRAARAHVEANYSWPMTFARLFGDIYPAALAQARKRSGAALSA